MNGSKRYRRYLVATAAALGMAALAGPASAAFTPTTIPLPLADSRPEGIALGGDGAIWYADFGGNQIGKTTGGPGLAYGVPNDGPNPPGTQIDVSGPADITRAPVGNDLWFTGNNSTVAKITAAGAITAYDLAATSPGFVRGITAANGALWFVGRGTTDYLRSISTAGAPGPVYDLSATGANLGAPEAISAGPAGDPNVYFTTGAGKVGKKNTNDVSPPALAGDVSGAASGITLGPDGNLWVTSSPGGGGGQVTKISPTTGVLASYPVGPVPKGITVGPDGAIWFTQAASNSVGRVTVDGQVSGIALSGCAGPEDIVTGADKALWVTCFGNNALVRIADSATGTPGPGTPGPGGPGTGPGPAVPGLKASFRVNKKLLTTRKFTVRVTFNNAVTKSRVRVQYRTVKTRGRGVIKKFKTLATKTVTGKKANFSVRIRKPGAYLLRVTYVNGPRTVNGKNVRVVVRKPARR